METMEQQQPMTRQDGGTSVGRRNPEACKRPGAKRPNSKGKLRDIRPRRSDLLLVVKELPFQAGGRGEGVCHNRNGPHPGCMQAAALFGSGQYQAV